MTDEQRVDRTRRSMLQTLGAGAGLTAISGIAGTPLVLAQNAAAESDKLPNGLPVASLKGEPAVIPYDRPFDMSNPRDAFYAKIKATNNLVGKKTYVAMFSRAYICPNGKPAAPLFGHCGLWTWQFQKATTEEFEDAQADSMVQRALYTGVILDPYTYKPVETLDNPYTGKTMTVEDSVFAMNYLIHPLGGGRDLEMENFVTEKTRPEVPHVRFGDDISFVLAGIFQGEGDYQPRADSSWWTTSYKRLMDPADHLIPTRYNFTGIMRAWQRPWLGVEKPDDTQLLWSVEGQKVHAVDDIPDMVHNYVLAKYPDRV